MLYARRPLLILVALAMLLAPFTGRVVLAQTPAGGTEITRASDGQTVHLPLGGTLTVRMGTELDWTVSIDPPVVLQPVPGAGPLERGVQALLRAAQAGTATLTAEGKPHCDPGQLCAQFIVSVIVMVIVDPGGSATPPPSPTQAVAPTPGATPSPSATPAGPGAVLPNSGAGAAAPQSGSGELLAALVALAGAGLLLVATWRLRRRGGAR